MTPEYLHLLLNHVPFISMGIGMALLIASIFRKSEDLRSAGLVLIALAGLLVLPVAESGEGATERMHSIADSTGQGWIEEHEERAEAAEGFAIGSAVLAALSFIASKRKPRFTRPLALLCLGCSMITLAMLGWTARAGGQIRHSEIRASAP